MQSMFDLIYSFNHFIKNREGESLLWRMRRRFLQGVNKKVFHTSNK